MRAVNLTLFLLLSISISASFRILAVFPYNGRSHHIYFSSLVEELASRNHDVTVINYFPVKNMNNLRQISLQTKHNEGSDYVNMEVHLKYLPNWFREYYSAYDTAQAFKFIANNNCEKLMNNEEIRHIIKSDVKFDVVIVEQFVTDCGLALAYKLRAPTVGMTAHILFPWTYSRLGAPNNPSFVPNHFFASGSKPDLLTRVKSGLINVFFDFYFKYFIQGSDYEIIKKVYPDTPDFEELGRSISLIMLNQYYPLTGSRLYGANVIEVGGMHIKHLNVTKLDKDLEDFMNSAKKGVVYISLGSVARNFPRRVLEIIIKVMQKSSELKFLWKVDDDTLNVPRNTNLRKWYDQQAILSHPKLLAFVTHSGMLSTSETIYHGVPIVSIPLFGDQFANAVAAAEIGLGVTVDITTLDATVLEDALETVLKERYQKRAKQLSKVWRDRPMTPMDTAVFWIEYVAKYQGAVDMKPANLDVPFYQVLFLDAIFIFGSVSFLILYVTIKTLSFVKNAQFTKKKNIQKKKKRN